ncbi:1-phosphatidylinositol-4,5-bisphosphate phosphodiesterase 1, partial [Termitomyces sp. T112]
MSAVPPPSQSPPLLNNESLFAVPEELLKGTMMTKVSEKKQKRVLFQLDPDAGCILYKSRKRGPVALETIKEIRSGAAAQYYREQFKLPEGTERRWLAIIYILDGAYKTLHMIADTHEIFAMWDVTVRKLVAVRQGLMIGLGNVDVREAIWARQYWKGADGNGDRKLSLGEVERLCWRLNARFSRPELEKMFKDADPASKGYLDYTGFQSFVRTLKRRPEIEQIYRDLCEANAGKFDFLAFEKFMKDTQHSKLTQDELKVIFAKYSWTAPTASAATTTESTSALALDASPPQTPDASSSTIPDAVQPPILTLEGFSSFLLSPENAAFSDKNQVVWQDMTRPASEYFVSASHNTYLVGHQLIGVSTVEGYIRALLHSCRSVELDIYDGDTEPVVFHGKTLTSKVSVRDICSAIAKYAFVTSPYPVLISAEIHCSVKQQDILVKIMTEVFGESLIRAPVEGRPRISMLPSPEDLKGKILLKAKNLYVVAQLEALRTKGPTASPTKQPDVLEADTSSDDSEDEEESNAKRISGEIRHGMQELKAKWRRVRGTSASNPKEKVKMSFSLASLLVYTVGVKCRGLGKEHGYAPEHIFSLSENKMNKMLKTGSTMRDLVHHTKDHMVRIYPRGTRVSSSNYHPHRFWAAGAQVVAINWQTFDLGYTMNQAMFQRNGRAGFVLKPEALRGNDELLSKYSKHVLEITIISAHQLPRLKDKRGQEVVEKSIVDPLVQVTLHIPDWTQPPFALTTGSTASLPTLSAPGDPVPPSSRIVTVRTRAVQNNGFNPIWRETLRLPFDVVGGKEMLDLVFVQISVLEDDYDEEDDEPIAVYCTPLSCLER